MHVACVAENTENLNNPIADELSRISVDLYCSLLQGVHLSPAMRQAFIDAADLENCHKKMLFNRNQALSSSFAGCIKSFCADDVR